MNSPSDREDVIMDDVTSNRAIAKLEKSYCLLRFCAINGFSVTSWKRPQVFREQTFAFQTFLNEKSFVLSLLPVLNVGLFFTNWLTDEHQTNMKEYPLTVFN